MGMKPYKGPYTDPYRSGTLTPDPPPPSILVRMCAWVWTHLKKGANAAGRFFFGSGGRAVLTIVSMGVGIIFAFFLSVQREAQAAQQRSDEAATSWRQMCINFCSAEEDGLSVWRQNYSEQECTCFDPQTRIIYDDFECYAMPTATLRCAVSRQSRSPE